ncbi:MAG TPA: pyruvate kinase [Acidimicrobiia bacterium]|jgi:pyruvate kinase|nr:pyruvate kinase [Acidimicrobiia bacterium]
MRRTKIVSTIGPATSTPEAMRALLDAGVDVVRLNAAHGTADVHKERAALARATANKLGRVVGVLVDLPGPKLRSGPVVRDEVELPAGAQFTLAATPIEGDAARVSTTVPELAQWVNPGDDVFLADGAIVLRVTAINDGDVQCEIVRGGILRSRKGMHVPRAEAHVDPFTAADETALKMAIDLKADFVGLSFVRRPEDVDNVRGRLPKRGARPQLVAKIETAVALDHLPGIVGAADAVMVARGDLGIQVPARRVPLLQKEIIRFCNMAGKPVITATQMLESMTESPLPTRAEVNDVANAVLDGTDALMLSEETAVGHYPTDTVRTMSEVAEAAESWPRSRTTPEGAGAAADDDRVAWAVAHAAVQAAEDLGVAAIVCPTQSGATARRVAAFRPSVPIAGIASAPEVLGRMCLAWGVRPISMTNPPASDDEAMREAVRAARQCGLVQKGDLIAVVFASPGKRAGATDTVRIVRA